MLLHLKTLTGTLGISYHLFVICLPPYNMFVLQEAKPTFRPRGHTAYIHRVSNGGENNQPSGGYQNIQRIKKHLSGAYPADIE